MGNSEIIVVLSTNREYVINCYITIYTISVHCNKENKYIIFVLENDLDDNSISLLEGLSRDYIKVTCKNVSKYINHDELKNRGYLSVETYFRLYIPLIIPKYRKVIYLDSDLCVLGDIEELYNYSVEDKVVGAVRDVPTTNIKNHYKQISEDTIAYPFNAGVLLIDVEKFEREFVRQKCIELLKIDNERTKKLYTYADQDALNIVLDGKVFFLDGIWNSQVQYINRIQVIEESFREQYRANINSAKILHFAGGDKLWLYPQYKQARVFWEYAKDTPVFNELLVRSFEKVRTIAFERYHFPYDLIPYGSRIVIYGAGKTGQMFSQQMKLTRYAKVVLWVDKKWENIDEPMGVVSPERIKDCDYDYVLIAINRKEIADKVREKLVGYSIPIDNIVWRQYESMV